MKKSIFIICMLASGCTAMAEQVEKPGPAIETQTLVPLTERVNVQADSACVNQIIDGCWVAVGAKKAHAIQRDFNLMFNGKPSYRFELKEDDNTLSGYAAGETKGRAEFSYCYATSDDFKGLPADVYQKAQITKPYIIMGKVFVRKELPATMSFPYIFLLHWVAMSRQFLPNGMGCRIVHWYKLHRAK